MLQKHQGKTYITAEDYAQALALHNWRAPGKYARLRRCPQVTEAADTNGLMNYDIEFWCDDLDKEA